MTAEINCIRYLSKGHDVVLDVRPRDGFGILAVISNYYSDGGIVSPDAVNKILKLFITQESLCSYGHEGTDVILCRQRDESKYFLLQLVLLLMLICSTLATDKVMVLYLLWIQCCKVLALHHDGS